MPIHGYPGNIVTANPTSPTSTTASGVWTLEQQLQAQAAGNWPQPPLQISRSLRFNSADSAYLNRTFTTPTNNKKWVYSCWLKRTGFLATLFDFALLTSATNAGALGISGTGAFGVSLNGKFFYANASGVYYYVNVEFRDPSAWYHFVFVADSDNATANDRQILYVNGVRQPNFSATLSLSASLALNSSRAHFIGGYAGGGATPAAGYYANGYLTETNFIDGQDLPSGATTWAEAFGEYNEDTGVWQPKAYTGSYGTNGFFLNFSDNSGVTSTTLGKDYSGNGNNWTPNNFSVTAGAGNDSLVDSPTNYGVDTGAGGEVRGNYCTWNPLAKSDNHTVSNGNLDISSSGATSYGAICATVGASSGKWYWEMLYNRSSASNSPVVGFGNDLFNYRNPPFGYLGSDLNAGGINVISGTAQINGTSTAYGSAIATNDIVMFAMDLDNRKFYIGKNGTWFNSGDPVAGTNSWPYSGTIVGSTFFPAANIFDNSAQTNFGQRPFAYTAPSGFKALCTQNLPEPTVVDGGEYFNTVLYAGTSPSTNSVTGVGFQPDLVWVKSRTSGTRWHENYDVLRPNKKLSSNATDAEYTENMTFDADGFTTSGGVGPNETGNNYVGWCWKANGAGVSNTAGTITSTVSANTDSGFSIVTYNSGASGNKTVGHGLGIKPSMIITKSRTSASFNWSVYHTSIATTVNKYLQLNTTAATSDNGSSIWGASLSDTNSTTFGINSGNGVVASTDCIAYVFAAIPGYSAFGSYTGNASADGPFVYTGFRPAFIMIKCSSTTGDWIIEDTSISPYNVSTAYLRPNTSDAETTGQLLDFVSNGFKIRVAVSGAMNSSGQTYIYAAFAENPFKISRAR